MRTQHGMNIDHNLIQHPAHVPKHTQLVKLNIQSATNINITY